MNARLHTTLGAERRIELLRGRAQVGGNEETTRLVLGQLLAQTSLAGLRDLGGDWQDAAHLALEPAAPKLKAPVDPTFQATGFDHRRHYSLLQRWSPPLFSLLKETTLTTHSRDIAVWLGDSAPTPDVFVGHGAAMRECYHQGPPLLAVEIIDPYNLREELERLALYAANRTPEVWWLEPERGCAPGNSFGTRSGPQCAPRAAAGWRVSRRRGSRCTWTRLGSRAGGRRSPSLIRGG